MKALRILKKVLSVGLNEFVNWGLEIGFALGYGKKVILLTEKNHQIPVMSLGMYYKVLEVDSLDDIDELIDFIL